MTCICTNQKGFHNLNCKSCMKYGPIFRRAEKAYYHLAEFRFTPLVPDRLYEVIFEDKTYVFLASDDRFCAAFKIRSDGRLRQVFSNRKIESIADEVYPDRPVYKAKHIRNR